MEQQRRRKKKSKKKRALNIIINIVLVLSIICFICSGAYLFRYYYISYRAEKNVSELAQKIDITEETAVIQNEKGEEEIIKARYLKLRSENSDFIGWISIEGTSLSYPVMYTPQDNEYYLHRNFKKEYEYSGLPFIDARCSVKEPSQNIIIYGHHMNTDTMFTALDKYMEKSFFEDNQYIQFDTLYQFGVYQICYVIKSRAFYEGEPGFRYYDFIESVNEEDFNNTIAELERLKLYDTGNTISMDDELITLSTCEYSQENGRLAVIAKRVQ